MNLKELFNIDLNPDTKKRWLSSIAIAAFLLMISGSISAAFSLPGTAALDLAVSAIIIGIIGAIFSLTYLYKTYYPDEPSEKSTTEVVTGIALPQKLSRVTPNIARGHAPVTTQAAASITAQEVRAIEWHLMHYLSSTPPHTPPLRTALENLRHYYSTNRISASEIPSIIAQALAPPSPPRARGDGIFYPAASPGGSSTGSSDGGASELKFGMTTGHAAQ